MHCPPSQLPPVIAEQRLAERHAEADLARLLKAVADRPGIVARARLATADALLRAGERIAPAARDEQTETAPAVHLAR